MALNIKHRKAEELARALASRTGESITETVIKALQERLQRLEERTRLPSLKQEILAISDRCAALPDFDTRTPEEILGFDEHGIPK